MKQLKPEDLTVLIDTREQLPYKFPCKTERATLTTGDYTVKGFERVIALERKSLPDLLQCVGAHRKRFSEEIMRLLAFPVRALIIETSFEEIRQGGWQRSRVHPNAVFGSLFSWASRGLQVIPAVRRESAEKYAFALMWYAVKHRFDEMKAVNEVLARPPMLKSETCVQTFSQA